MSSIIEMVRCLAQTAPIQLPIVVQAYTNLTSWEILSFKYAKGCTKDE